MLQVRLKGILLTFPCFLCMNSLINENLSRHLRGSGKHICCAPDGYLEAVQYLIFVVCVLVDDRIYLINITSLDRDPLEWSTRVQIALDSAGGLEYIHEHTVPDCIHRDIKSPNIL